MQNPPKENPASPVWNRPMLFIQIIITNIAFDRINFLVLGSVVQYRLNVAFFPPVSPLHMSLHEIKRGMESGAGNWKEGSCCVVETNVPAAISSAHATPRTLDRCMFALSNNPHGPWGENSGPTRDAVLVFTPVFEVVTGSLLGCINFTGDAAGWHAAGIQLSVAYRLFNNVYWVPN